MPENDLRQLSRSAGAPPLSPPQRARHEAPTGHAADPGRLRAEAAAVLHDHYREMFLGAQRAREQIRGGIGTPVAATAFTVFNLGTVVQHFDVARWQEPVSLAIAGLALATVLAVLGAAYNVVMVEWRFVHVEPPDLDELLRLHQHAAEMAALAGNPLVETAAGEELRKALVGGYYAGYVTLMLGNARSARYRTRALRLVLLALTCVALAFLLLPLHLAGGTP